MKREMKIFMFFTTFTNKSGKKHRNFHFSFHYDLLPRSNGYIHQFTKNTVICIVNMERGNERNRIPNFSTGEKVCLMNICKKYQKVLEDKQTNRTSIDDKNKIWTKIENEFNSQASIICYRSSEQLKRLYANKKKELRKKFADLKKSTYITEGGPPPPDPKLDAADTILISMLNEHTVSGFYSEFDSDNSGILEPSEKKRKTECDTQIYEFDPATGSLIEETDSENNGLEELNKEEENRAAKTYRKCPPGILQKPVNQKLMVSPSCQSKETEKVQTSLSTSVSTKNSSTPKAKPFNRRRPIGG
ncbi:uncharacterized protein isoform X2 [Leptinotarsa decemlineata]